MSSSWSKPLALSVLLALTLVVTACTPAATTRATVVVATNATYGKFLTDAKGMALYFYMPYTAAKGPCFGCLAAWPALTVAKDTTPVAGAGVTGKLGTITRDDGTLQVTINDRPLYYFAQDEVAGDTRGHRFDVVGYLSDPTGNLIK